ncbi:MAG: hypothetical protein ACNYPH_01410 [Gammaproteobacteria bacterium WSBS_2016_MAG_OTU1]
MLSEAEIAHLYLESEITARYYRLLSEKYATLKSRLNVIITVLIATALFVIIFKLILPSSNIGSFISNVSAESLKIIVFNNIQSNLVWVISAIALFYPIAFIKKSKNDAINKLSVATRVHIAWNRASIQYEKLYIRCKNDEYVDKKEADKIELSLQPIEMSIDKTFPKQDKIFMQKAEQEAADLFPHLYHL